ncbi:hypothetical protein CC2G_013513 [Coprinopsis cinerea AmutBmut pab1-1]|nr:hypothetical protein CC2G_013513 [Coprinopsis cinerea AmutBmut pab1-1]
MLGTIASGNHEGRRILMFDIPYPRPQKWSCNPQIKEWLNKCYGKGLTTQQFKVLWVHDNFLAPQRTDAFFRYLFPNPNPPKAVSLTSGWPRIYEGSRHNRDMEITIDFHKTQFMKYGLGTLVNEGWNIMSYNPYTSFRAWQVIEFLLSDEGYIWDPIFRIPRGYVWNSEDNLLPIVL